jgi:hypothetical protein
LKALAIVAVIATAGCGSGHPLTPEQEAGAACDGFTMPNPAGAGLPNPAAYTDNGDGTILDNVTGLTWEGTVGDAGYTQDDATAHCAAKGAGWRLPTRLELVSLVDFTARAPAPTINAIFQNTPSAVFWTSSLYAGNSGDEWNVGFDIGYSDYGVRNNPSLARCVLPPASHCTPTRYETQPGGLIVDHATGLTWQQNLDPKMYTWSEAQAFCAGVGAGWRVPSLTELQTIIDDTKEYPATDEAIFPNTPSVVFWTSSPRTDDPSSAWRVDFFYGATDSDVTDRPYQVRCVR